MKELFYPLSEIISEELLTDHNYYNSCYQSEVKLFPGIAITSLIQIKRKITFFKKIANSIKVRV